ncbi:MAG TPA: DUF1330 domain-containing protein [Thermoanaerobaculia bacterium]|nr:DUF1330 domain-containing protein [Thermoanaerobaculia bacterium]
MKYYSVAEIHITDRAWVHAYVQNVTGMVERYGGRYLARTSNAEKWEGERALPQIVLLVEWPSRDAAKAFYDSEEYAPYLRDRLAGSQGEMVFLAGEDVARLAKLD